MSLDTVASPMTAYRYYLFQFEDPVQVFFVENANPVTKGGLFHTLSFPSEKEGPFHPAKCEFEHLCIRDLYEGTFEIVGGNKFHWGWRITGPAKDGKIFSVYEKEGDRMAGL